MDLLATALLAFVIGTTRTPGQNISTPGPTPAQQASSQGGPAEALYLKLKSIGLDASKVFRIRDVTLDRAALHLTLENGTIAFTEDVGGHISGALFEGDGEVLLSPPNQAERSSMALFTGEAILEESFTTAYMRFNDETYTELQPYLKSADGSTDFVSHWNGLSRALAENDALRLLLTFSRDLPVKGLVSPAAPPSESAKDHDQFLHAWVQGRKLGLFDVAFDSEAPEQNWAGQFKKVEGVDNYDLWTSFSSKPISEKSGNAQHESVEAVHVTDYKIRAKVVPPTRLEAETRLHLQVQHGGQRALLFELSRDLQITTSEADGQPVEFIHNPSLEGTQRARRGNDVVAVVFPQPLRSGQALDLRFSYAGDVLAQAGPGLLYVGARGTWYPNPGLAMANFDLQFEYPSGWTLVATGREVQQPDGNQPELLEKRAGVQVSRWISDRPLPVAGFNLGKYQRAAAHAGNVAVEVYATTAVEADFPQRRAEAVSPGGVPVITKRGGIDSSQEELSESRVPSPARNEQAVADEAAEAVEFYSRYFGPYPSDTLILTQMPGRESQGWPGLIYLSSLAFLTREELSRLTGSEVDKVIAQKLVVSHETAHQWWGQLVDSASYRDQWWVEALANYSALMLLQSKDPSQFHSIMEKYRNDLLRKENSRLLLEDGPVSLGVRLSNSEFPSGYMAISYGRGTWLFHMLRYMLLDAEKKESGAPHQSNEEPFLRSLRKLRDKYAGKSITTQQLLDAFEEDLPPSLRYEGRKSLEWFFQGWIDGTAVPSYELKQEKFTDGAGSTLVSGVIQQKDASTDLVTSVPLYASRAGRLTFMGRVFADGPETAFHLHAPLGTRKVIVDPYETVLRRSH
jgi:hypothetical protein